MIPLVLAIIIVSVLAVYGGKQLCDKYQIKIRQKVLANTFQRLVVQHRLVVDHCEILHNRAFLLDRKNKKLLAIDRNRHTKQETCIPLLSVAETKVVEEKSSDGYVERISLVLKHKWNHMVYRLCFFDRICDDQGELPGLTRRAVFWKAMIDTHKYPGTVRWGQEYVL